jgi:hypothetical protein
MGLAAGSGRLTPSKGEVIGEKGKENGTRGQREEKQEIKTQQSRYIAKATHTDQY